MRKVVRHPDGSKNKICQRAPVLESQWRPSSNYHCCLAVTLLWEWLQSKPRGKNPELESLRQFVVVLDLILATPATSLVSICNGPAVPLDPSPTWRERGGGGGGVGEGGGGEHAARATACSPHNTAQAYIQYRAVVTSGRPRHRSRVTSRADNNVFHRGQQSEIWLEGARFKPVQINRTERYSRELPSFASVYDRLEITVPVGWALNTNN